MKYMNVVDRQIFFMGFEVGIGGKDPMDQEEEDWGGKVEFGFHENTSPTDLEDYFFLFEDKCSLSHTCAGRIMGIQSHARDKVLKPPVYEILWLWWKNMEMLT